LFDEPQVRAKILQKQTNWEKIIVKCGLFDMKMEGVTLKFVA
jgi:hypothetical protein